MSVQLMRKKILSEITHFILGFPLMQTYNLSLSLIQIGMRWRTEKEVVDGKGKIILLFWAMSNFCSFISF